MGAAPGGSNGHAIQHQAANVPLPLSPSGSGGSGRTGNTMGHLAEGVHLPALHPPRPTIATHPSVSRDASTSVGPMGISHKENTTPYMGHGQPDPILPPDPDSGRQDTHGSVVEICTMDRASFLRQTFERKFGPDVAQALLHAFRSSTEHAWKALQQWLRSVPATTLSNPLLLQFLRWL